MVAADEAIVTRLVAAIYRSAYDPSEWAGTIELFRLSINSARACLVRIGPDMRPTDVLATEADPQFNRAFAQDRRLHDNPFAKIFNRMPVGPVVRHEEIWNADLLHRSPLWNEYLSPQGIHSVLMSKTLATASSYWFFGASRSSRNAAFGEAERGLMEVLAPHVRRANEIGRALALERRSFDPHVPWIGSDIGTAIVDSEQRITRIDQAAEAILTRAGCPLRRRGGRLEVEGVGGLRFAEFVRRACRVGGDLRQAAGGEMIARADLHLEGTVDVMVSIGPMGEPDAAPLAEPSALLAMRELSPDLPATFAATAARIFDLTEREAGVAASLSAGRSLQQAAASAGIAVSTARWYLDQVYRKTGTHQQSELVALMRTIEPLVRRG